MTFYFIPPSDLQIIQDIQKIVSPYWAWELMTESLPMEIRNIVRSLYKVEGGRR